jgi:hypothetical protein
LNLQYGHALQACSTGYPERFATVTPRLTTSRSTTRAPRSVKATKSSARLISCWLAPKWVGLAGLLHGAQIGNHQPHRSADGKPDR